VDYFQYRNGGLYAEEVELGDIATAVGTPCYVYSRATVAHHWRIFEHALREREHLICYAVKANSNIAILSLLSGLGSGFDVVSGGELERVVHAGGDPKKTVFSGVGKSEDEIRRALDVGIHCFNVESESELHRIEAIAKTMNRVAPVALRVNPDVDARTHPYIATGLRTSKFGIDIAAALPLYKGIAASPYLEVLGIDCHIGSQLTDVAPFIAVFDRLQGLIEQLYSAGIKLQHIDVGGGLGIRYKDETPPSPVQFAAAMIDRLPAWAKIIIEPGRAIMGNAGILVTRIEYLKHTGERNFAIVNAGMNDFMRPALYDAWQEIVAVRPRNEQAAMTYDVVGPVCETADFLGKQRRLAVQAGDLLAVRSAGAYGFSMSSNYNSRPRPAEVLVDGNRFFVIRERETVSSLWQGEVVPWAKD